MFKKFAVALAILGTAQATELEAEAEDYPYSTVGPYRSETRNPYSANSHSHIPPYRGSNSYRSHSPSYGQSHSPSYGHSSHGHGHSGYGGNNQKYGHQASKSYGSYKQSGNDGYGRSTHGSYDKGHKDSYSRGQSSNSGHGYGGKSQGSYAKGQSSSYSSGNYGSKGGHGHSGYGNSGHGHSGYGHSGHGHSGYGNSGYGHRTSYSPKVNPYYRTPTRWTANEYSNTALVNGGNVGNGWNGRPAIAAPIVSTHSHHSPYRQARRYY